MNDIPFTLIAAESVAHKILLIQGHNVMTDADSIDLNGVPTGALSHSVRWNLEPFPSDFMYN